MTATASKPRRARSLASDEAHAWARNLRLGNHHAKSVLLDLTLYVDGDGRAFVSIEQIADDIEIACNTVRRRLVWLEQVGALVRFPQWIDENGKRNGDGRGKRTTDEIRLLIEADADAIEAKAAGLSACSERGPQETDDEFSPPSEAGLNDDAVDAISPPCEVGLNPVSPALALQQPSHSGEGLISEPEPEESPPAPPSGGAREHDDSWKEFCAEWREPMTRPSLAQQVWNALDAAERQRAITAAKGYFAWLKAQRKPPTTVSAQTFLREIEGWPQWSVYVPAEVEKTRERVFETEGSPSWKARLVIAAIAGHVPPQARSFGDQRGAKFARPLTTAELALAQFADQDPNSWPIAKAGSQSCGAWRRFLGIEPRRIKTGTCRFEYRPGRWADDWPKTEEGLRVPHPWPPRKDGSLSTAPPENLMSEADLEFVENGKL